MSIRVACRTTRLPEGRAKVLQRSCVHRARFRVCPVFLDGIGPDARGAMHPPDEK